jgi:ElaB/YqjD/DUF883 family membrane-anchored ribosome-binding protein
MLDDVNAEKEEFATTVNDAVKAIRAAVDEFTLAASVAKSETADALKNAGYRAAGQLNDLAGGAQDYADRSVASLSRSVSANPIGALALAGGAGVLIGLAMRGGRR